MANCPHKDNRTAGRTVHRKLGFVEKKGAKHAKKIQREFFLVPFATLREVFTPANVAIKSQRNILKHPHETVYANDPRPVKSLSPHNRPVASNTRRSSIRTLDLDLEN
jgi:hypothetical protein